MIVSVAVNIPFASPYDYLVPESLSSVIYPGVRVLVPLGTRGVIGVVVGIVQKTDVKQLKSIIGLVEPEALYSSQMLEFTRWMADYYLCSWAETLDAALPGGLKPKVKQKIQVDFNHQLFQLLPESDQIILQELNQKPASILKTLPFKKQAKNLKRWKSEKLLEQKSYFEGEHHGMPTTEQLRLNSKVDSQSKVRKGSKADLLMNLLREKDTVDLPTIKKSIPNITPVIKKLLDQEVVVKQTIPVSQQPNSNEIKHDCFLELYEEQQNSFKQIEKAIHEHQYHTFLLSGVTGSGKTEVYLHAVRESLQKCRSALILIPEISLTPQAVNRFEERFGDRVAVLHSGMNDKERAAEWWKIKNGVCDIVIGARSAIFAPLENIGLIVVDEEHDSSYKQQEAPFYNARDAAVKLASDLKAVVVLGSATPAIESFYNSQVNKYSLLKLTQRANLKPLPQTGVISLKQERRQPGIFYLSIALIQKMKDTIAAGKQVLVFLNRRGFAAFLSCKSCDMPVLCGNCSIAMTWHKTRKRLVCHHCGNTSGYPSNCDSCKEHSFRMEGIGTQRIEQDLAKFFPDSRFLRMDRDTIQRKGALEKSIEMINNHEVDFVIGTQLISKGHDFKSIGLVCIVLADMSLNIPDFRSSERSFQLMSQVSGRAGRDETGEGITLIQTYNPDHFAITSAVENNYLGFYHQELDVRKVLANPPFTRLILLKISSMVQNHAQSAAIKLGKILKDNEDFYSYQTLGPIEAPIQKVNKRYYWQILLKAEKMGGLKKFIGQLFWERKNLKIPGNTRVSIDVDPYQML